MNVVLDIASDQIDGARDYQEDAFMVSLLGDNDAGNTCALMVMADGMGGHAAGNVASNMVVATFIKSFQSDFDGHDVSASLTTSLNRSNQQIHDSIAETPALKGMGCTMVAAYLEANRLFWISVGDSHLYLIRNRELIKQNADHSYGAYMDMMKEQGMEVNEQMGMSRNMLMSAMTGDEISSIDCPTSPIKLKSGDRLIIASDGLDSLGAGAIIQYSSWSSTARECVYALLKAVEEANKINQDNTTIIVVDIKEKEEAESKAPPVSKQPRSKIVADEPALSRIAVSEEKKSSSSKGLMVVMLLILATGGAWYAWQQGMLRDVMSLLEGQVERFNSVEPELIEPPAQIRTPPPEPVAPRELTKQPVIAKPEPLVQEKYVDRSDPFTDRLKIGVRGPIMIKIPAGSFRMGNASGLISADETPRHAVTVADFVMSVYEVTYAEYDVFAKATGRSLPESNGWDRKTHPVNNVSWDDAVDYATWLSNQTGKKYRLPSEAEWEYAARGGQRTTYWWGAQKGSGNAHCFDCNSDLNMNKPAKVGSYKPNQFGLYDTAGNLFEWVHDCYHRNYQDAPSDGSVWQGGDCSVRVVRGGSYRSPASSMRVENRDTFPSNKGQYNVGIRLARDL